MFEVFLSRGSMMLARSDFAVWCMLSPLIHGSSEHIPLRSIAPTTDTSVRLRQHMCSVLQRPSPPPCDTPGWNGLSRQE